MAEPTLTFGPVASLSGSTTTSTPTPNPNPDSTPSSSTTQTHTQSQLFGDPVYGGGSGMSQVENSNAPSSILPLGPVFGSSVVLVIVVVLAMRWNRRGSWRGVLGLGDGLEGVGIGGGAEGELGRRPEVFDSFVLFKPSFVEKVVDEEEWADWTWRDVKPISAKLAPFTGPATSSLPRSDAEAPTQTLPQPNPPGRPTSLFQKAFSSSRTAKSTNTNNVDCSCQQLSAPFPQKPKLRLPPRRIHVTVLISMPTPPPPHPTSPPPRQEQQLTYDDGNSDYSNNINYNNDNNEHEQKQNDSDDEDEKLSHYETASDASSVSEISKEKAKANARSRRTRSDAAFDSESRRIVRPRTAELSLALGITEVDVYDL